MLKTNIERPSGDIYSGYYERKEWEKWSPLKTELADKTNFDLMKAVLSNAGRTTNDRLELINKMVNEFPANEDEKKYYGKLALRIDVEGDPKNFAIRFITGTMNFGIPCIYGLAGIVNKELISQVEAGNLQINENQERSWNRVRMATTALVTNLE